MKSEKKPSIVLCHGIWADASCFNKIIPKLIGEGHEVISVQYGLTNFDHDVAAIKRTISRVSSPVILVGHSYGGAVTNTFKYAFPDRPNGEVYVGFGRIKDQIRLEIADNGKGMDPHAKLEKDSGVGLKLIRGLCEDIDAKMTIKNASGTRIVILCNSEQSLEEINLDRALDHLPDSDMS